MSGYNDRGEPVDESGIPEELHFTTEELEWIDNLDDEMVKADIERWFRSLGPGEA